MWDLSSPSRDWTCFPCTGRQILNHWTTREVLWDTWVNKIDKKKKKNNSPLMGCLLQGGAPTLNIINHELCPRLGGDKSHGWKKHGEQRKNHSVRAAVLAGGWTGLTEKVADEKVHKGKRSLLECAWAKIWTERGAKILGHGCDWGVETAEGKESRWRRNRTGRSLSLLQIHRKDNRTVNKVYKTTSDR